LVNELRLHQVELEMQNEQLRATERTLELQNDRLRAADAQLEQSRAQYRDLFDLAPVGYVSLDAGGVIRGANLAAEFFLGAKHGTLIQRSLRDAVDAADAAVLDAHLAAAARSCHACEVRLWRADGNSAYARVESRPAPYGGCWTVLMDISERKRAEDALSVANQALEDRTRELAARNETLEEALRARAASEAEASELAARLRDAERLESLGLLAGGIAHDFNNLLVGVIANADLLLATAPALSDEVRQGLTTINDAARSAADLTRQLLVYAGRGQVTLQSVQLGALIRQTLRLLRTRLPAGVELRAELARQVAWIVADPGQIQQVIANLVTNAGEALSVRGGQVVVRTRLEPLDARGLARFPHGGTPDPGVFAVLDVEDTGAGIDAAHLSRIFEPFFTTKFTGRGLGLATVLGIVRAHGAALRVTSEPGRGTRFEIIWPLAVPEVASTPAPPVPISRWRGAGQVLLVDDDPMVLRTLARQLEHLGFEVARAATGAEALAIFRSAPGRFRLAVVDRTMPGLSGDELLELLHELEPALPALLVSGYSTGRPVETNQRVAFLAKPMTLETLGQALERLLEAKRLGPPIPSERASATSGPS
jgi:PAS domain S-box-containing protein